MSSLYCTLHVLVGALAEEHYVLYFSKHGVQGRGLLYDIRDLCFAIQLLWKLRLGRNSGIPSLLGNISSSASTSQCQLLLFIYFLFFVRV